MKLTFASRLGSAFVLAGAALLSSAQIFPNQRYYDAKHEVILPPSGVLTPGHRRTHYLVLNKPIVPFVSKFALPSGYGGSSLRDLYSIPDNLGTNAIAIVDAFHNTTSLSDFNTYASTFGLPQETSSDPTASTNKVFQVVYAQGSQPTADQGWSGEICLDIESAHAMAPKAKIYLVEAASNAGSDLVDAVTFASKLPGVKEISMSYGGGEYAGELSEDARYNLSGIACFASSGDTGGFNEYPSESPNVIGVGGTTIVRNAGIGKVTEKAWDGSGGGPSPYEPRPSFQNLIQGIVGAKRGTPDVSAVADPATGAAVYGSFAFGGWAIVGGTSLACPVNAGIANARGSFAANSSAEHDRIYRNLGSKLFRDVTTGSAGAFTASVGWDYITGCGSPVGLYVAPQDFPPTTVSTMYGTYASGTIASILAADGSSYTVNSTVLPSFGPAAGVIADLPFTLTNGKTIQDVSVTATTLANTTYATIQIFAYDWTKGTYVAIKATPSSLTSKTITAPLPTGDFTSAGKVRIAIRALVPFSYKVPSFSLSVDQIKTTFDFLG